ncbi:hypothetical protein VNO77_37244 [Canavalia gladiata]|uniref:Uncharacterized protein n=1 Tax=Canavalia gladiata TaxID=3824 RepID=A0AAN9PYB3_CANGL
MNESLLNQAAIFLKCQQDRLPFSHLGIPIDINLRKRNSLDPYGVESFSPKENNWLCMASCSLFPSNIPEP